MSMSFALHGVLRSAYPEDFMSARRACSPSFLLADTSRSCLWSSATRIHIRVTHLRATPAAHFALSFRTNAVPSPVAVLSETANSNSRSVAQSLTVRHTSQRSLPSCLTAPPRAIGIPSVSSTLGPTNIAVPNVERCQHQHVDSCLDQH